MCRLGLPTCRINHNEQHSSALSTKAMPHLAAAIVEQVVHALLLDHGGYRLNITRYGESNLFGWTPQDLVYRWYPLN